MDTMILVNIGTLFVGVVTLIVALLCLRGARWAGQLADEREEHHLEEQQERFEIIRGLRQGMDWERQERQSLREELDHERQERLRAQQELVQAQRRAEHAEQKAMREATQQLRARMDDYLKELGEEGTLPGIRRVK